MGGGKRNRHSGANRGGNSKPKNASNQHEDASASAASARSSSNNSNASSDDDSASYEEEEEALDFCQRFFGDPLFSNLNVSLLFLTATFLPMIVWIPHFLSEYNRLRHAQRLEEERLVRVERARAEVTSVQAARKNGGAVASSSSSVGAVLELNEENYKKYIVPQQEMDRMARGEDGAQGGSAVEGVSAGAGDAADGGITILQDAISPLQNSKSTIHHIPEHAPGGEGASSAQSESGGSSLGDESDTQQYERQARSVLPTLCPDGITIGYDNWFLLRDAVTEANAIAAEEFLRWNEYLVNSANRSAGGDGVLAEPVYHPPEPFVICPGVTLNQKSPYRSIFSPYYWASYIVSFLPYGGRSAPSISTTTTTKTTVSSAQSAARSSASVGGNKGKLSPIFINAEDITIECDMCTIDLPGTHFSFGPHAKNVLIRGITFRGATSSSLTFHHHGADVSLEDCYWLYNSGGVVSSGGRGGGGNAAIGNDGHMQNSPGSTTTAGAVADLNSTSTVAFYRCVIDDVKQNPKRTTTGAGVANVPGMNPPAGHHAGVHHGGMNHHQGNGGGMASSSLTIRN